MITVLACAIHGILSAAVDIGIVIFRQSSHSDVLLTPTVFSFHTSLPLACSFPFFACHPYILFHCFIITTSYDNNINVDNNIIHNVIKWQSK